MAQAKINTQHDYISLRVTFAKGIYVTLTLGRYGTKASGTVADRDLHAAFGAFDRYMRRKDGCTNAVKFERAQKAAETAQNPAELVTALNGIAPVGPVEV